MLSLRCSYETTPYDRYKNTGGSIIRHYYNEISMSNLILRTSLCLTAEALWLLLAGCTPHTNSPDQAGYFTVLVTVVGSGKVTSSGQLTHVKGGSAVVMTAVPDSGATFACWNGDLRSTANPLSVTVSKNLSLTCEFGKRPASMVKILSSGQTFVMGSAGALSSPCERPPHPVMFTYDYFIDACEVTQGEYSRIMGVNPASANATMGTAGIGDSFPVYYVRWYDAVLFCNAKSKLYGFDTVYSYTAVCNTGQICPYVLENLAAHYDRLGYRLPTEAEWEYACRAGSTTEYFWGADTTQAASYAWYGAAQSQPVGQKKPNAFGLYDMAGNVAEWVNDWLGAYSDSLNVNPIGPTGLPLEKYEDSLDRPIRGGCYSLGTSFLRSADRTGPYAVTAATLNKYTGFRTAMGAFFPDTSSKPSSQPQESLSVTIDAQKSDILSFIGTWRIKLVFTVVSANGTGRLCYVDYTDPNLTIRQLPDSTSVNRPTISPNGVYVAYSSKREGFTGQSTITVRPLDYTSSAKFRTPVSQPAFLPRWFVDPAALDTFLVYVNSASMNDLSTWQSEQTLRQKVSGLSFSGQPEILTSQGSFHGGLSRDGEFLATGYPRALVNDLKGNRVIRYFLPPYNGFTDLTDTVQVCNVTISPSLAKPDEIMFLDFGDPSTNTIVGKSYGFHSVIFIANSNTQAYHHVTNWFAVPSGFSSWDDVAWSNHPNFAAAVGNSSSSGSSGSVFLINIASSAYLQLLSGQGLADPMLWIDPRDLSEAPDPYVDFGMYNIPSYGIAQLYLGEELSYFWSHSRGLACCLVGSSHVMMDVDPSRLVHTPASIIGVPGLEVVTGRNLTRNYLLPQAPNLKVIGMSLDPGWIPLDYSLPDPHGIGWVNSRGYIFDNSNNFWKSGVPAGVQTKIGQFNSSTWPDFDTSCALICLPAGTGWGPPLYDGGDFAFTDTSVQTYLSLIKTLTDSLATLGIHFLLVKFPENPAYVTTGYVSRYGPNYNTYDQIAAWFRSLELQNQFFHFYDANMDGAHDYTDAEAHDCNHLNALGRAKMSTRLDSVIATFVK